MENKGIEKAIKCAIEGGYEPFASVKYSDLKIVEVNIFGDDYIVDVGLGMPYRKSINKILLDPLFWQCLGKQQGWSEFGMHETRGNNLRCYRCGERFDDPNPCPKNPLQMCKRQWHNFIDHIAVGGSIDEFFNNLLKD